MFQPMSRGHLSELPKEDIAYRQAIPGVVHNQLRQISHEEVEERSSISSRKQDEAHAMNETVLLIDDSKFLRRANELAISRSGYRVLVAADGDEGLRLAREKVPDVIVLDMLLPKLSGEQLIMTLKADPNTVQIPIIVLSSLPQSNEAKLKQAGAAAYLEKSKLAIDAGSTILVQAIESALQQRSQNSRESQVAAFDGGVTR
jgi:CheY-like chemotaxis protein